jgi:hypothetical protein
VEDKGEPKLKNEIIIYLRAQSIEPKPAYFEFSSYEFRLAENNPKPAPFELRLINDNLGPNRVNIEELRDPLNLLSLDFEENFVTRGDLVNLAINNHPATEITNDLFVYLYPSNISRDFDQLFVENNRSDVYVYKLRASLADKPELFTDVTIFVKLIGRNLKYNY